jgi:methionine synthase / methylenetetrahydrofolate reductase (NADH)
MKSFLQAIDERVLVCDGAMGTLLYAKGVFINRSFDALNLLDPPRVRDIHEQYVRAGADVIETNTFGANRIKLRAFGQADRLAEINVEGARLARGAAAGRAYVAGAIGPLGIRIEPWGRTGRDEAEALFREQAQALVEGGVDLFVLETFRDVSELGAAIAGVRATCALPIVAQMTIEEDGNTLDGTPPEQFVPALQAFGADVIGINCSIGPAHMLETIERMAALTTARLSAQPNAGRPRDVEGRTIYLTSPEYMASYARRFVEHGVRLVGGCCGTTPEHVRQIKASVVRADARHAGGHARGVSTVPSSSESPPVTPTPRAEKSYFAHTLAVGRFATMVEVLPAQGHDGDAMLEWAGRLRVAGIDAVHVPDGWSGARMSALSAAVLIQQRTGIEASLQYSCRDRNLLGMQSDLLGAHAMGIRNLVIVTGDVQPAGDYPDASAVFDVDSIGLVNVVARLNRGVGIGGQRLGRPTSFHVGVMVNPTADELETEIRRFEYKVEAGAEFVVTRPVFDAADFTRLYPRIASAGLPIVLSLRPLDSALDAEFMANEVPGVHVPPVVVERMRRAGSAEAAMAEGVSIAREVGQALRSAVQGIHLTVAHGRLDDALELVEALR